MEDRKENIPAVRFKGFTDAWEQRKLGDIGSVAMNKRIFKEQTSDTGEIPFFKIGTFGGEADAFITRELYEDYKMRYPYPKVGDLLISASGSVGKIVEYTGKDEYFQDSNIVWLKHDGRIKNSFLKQFYKIVKWSGLEGSTIKRLYNKNILETEISFPISQEQELLGILFSTLDTLITLQQSKLEQLKILKKSLLSKMFPFKDENIPEIRFRDFTDAWEQRKLGEYAGLITKGTTPRDKSGRGTVNFVKVENISEGVILPGSKISVEEHEAYLQRSKLKENDILISIAGTLGRVGFVNKTILPANTNQALAIVRDYKFNRDFLLTSLNGNTIKSFIRRNPTIGAQPNLSLKQIENFQIYTPLPEEQKLVGHLFSTLDTFITLQQRELELLKNMKKSLLKAMFI